MTYSTSISPAAVATATPRPAAGSSVSADRARRTSSRLIGALYLAGFLAYGTGFALVGSVTGQPDFLATMAAHRSTVTLGAILMLLTIVTDIWRAVVFYPVLGERGRSAALTYLAAQIVSVVLFFIGAIALLLLVPLGAEASDPTTGWASGLAALLVHANGIAYQIAQLALAFGSLSLWLYGFRVRLIPRVLAGWALLGYVVLLVGTVAELFGLPISLWLSIPGGLFELALPIWLFVRGFSPSAYAAN